MARAKDTAEYPANFIMVATANPCPCGYYGVSNGASTCRCPAYHVQRYQQRLSGPILDRIDLYSTVQEVNHDKLLQQSVDEQTDAKTSRRILKARGRQSDRYGRTNKLNTDMTNADIKRFGQLETEAESLLNTAAQRLNLSARAYMRCVKVARTIADLEAADQITSAHISEALAYRSQNRKE